MLLYAGGLKGQRILDFLKTAPSYNTLYFYTLLSARKSVQENIYVKKKKNTSAGTKRNQ